MPGMIACNRRWEIGSDDIIFPAVAEILLLMPWLIISFGLYCHHLRYLQCPEAYLTHVSLLGTDAILMFIIILDVIIAYISAQGTVFHEKSRRHITKFIYLRFALVLLEIGWNSFGTHLAFVLENSFCSLFHYALFTKVTTIYGWIMIGSKVFFIFIVYDPLGAPKYRNKTHKIGEIEKNKQYYIDWSDPLSKKKVQLWKYRTKFLCYCCCCLVTHDDNTEDAVQNIAELSAYLWGDCDIVISDVIAGSKLMKRKNLNDYKKHVSQLEKHTTLGAAIGKPDAVFPPSSGPSWMTMELACHYMKFTRGIFGWPLLAYSNFSNCICQMWKDLMCCFCARNPPHIKEDNCLKCNTAALLRTAEISYDDLVYASFHDSVYKTPFFVALDHLTSSVVIVIRGSMSMCDVMTDFAGGFDELCVDGCPKDTWCHHGMFHAALYVKKELESRNVLQNLFNTYPNYTLVLTGHSLGAATATILAFLYRPLYPNLRCYAYAPAACVSASALAYSEGFVFTIVYGNDMIPTFAVRSGENMIAQVMDCLAHCDQPKYKVLVGKYLSHSEDTKGSPSIPSSSSQIQGCVNHQTTVAGFPKDLSNKNHGTILSSEDMISNGKPFPSLKFAAPQLYPPGRVLHIGVTTSGFRLRWISSDFYKNMCFIPRMLGDHFPHLMQDVLLQFNNNPTLQISCMVI